MKNRYRYIDIARAHNIYFFRRTSFLLLFHNFAQASSSIEIKMNMRDLSLNRVPTVEEVNERRAAREAKTKRTKSKKWTYEETVELINLMSMKIISRDAIFGQ